jgi:hypothetical protein
VGSLITAAALAVALADQRHDFATAAWAGADRVWHASQRARLHRATRSG